MNARALRIHFHRIAAAHALLFLLLIFACGFVASGLAFARAHQPADSQAVPLFRIGEQLRYRIDWQKYAGAAYAELDVIDRGRFFGVGAWHFRASVHTTEPARAFFPLDDEADSYARPAGLASFRYQERFQESGKPEDTYAEFIPSGDASGGAWPRVVVPQGTHDPVSAIYSLREADWRRVPEVRLAVYDGEDLYEIAARSMGTEKVSVEAGEYLATRIAIRLLQNGRELPDEHFTLWLANDATQTPVRLDAQLPFGDLHLELTSSVQAQNKLGNKQRMELPVNLPQRSSHPAEN
ncbi:MAG: DUF3108 domain-containing protein [Candidatus Acidiferrales bacterium]